MKKKKFGLMVCAAVLLAIFSATPVWAVVASSYDLFLGSVPLGSCNTEMLTLTNNDAGTVMISDYEFLNTSAAFSIVTPPALPYTLPPEASVDFIVQFCPVHDSFDQGTLHFSINGGSTPHIYITVWGEGLIGGCLPPLVDCGGVCVDVNYDVNNCGTCGNVCPDPVGGVAVCDMGVCAGYCDDIYLSYCYGVCVDIDIDPNNCGACGNVCAASEVCVDGECTTYCGDLTNCDGLCVDTDTDVNNCGACGIICSAPQNSTALCVAGVCDFQCNPGFIRDGYACVPVTGDPRELLVELIEFYSSAIREGTLEGIGGWWWYARLIREWAFGRLLNWSLASYDLGRMDLVCFFLNRAYLRTDGERRPRDHVTGPAAPELADRILEVMTVLECR